MPEAERPSTSKKPSTLGRIFKWGTGVVGVVGYLQKWDDFVATYHKHHQLINAVLLLLLYVLVFIVETLLLVAVIDIPIVFGLGISGLLFDKLTGNKHQIHQKLSWTPKLVLIFAFIKALYLESHYGLVGAFPHLIR